MADPTVSLFLCGDVMLGRGVDQILAHPGDPLLHELAATDARVYVDVAEAINGPIPAPVDDTWPWGDVLPLLDAYAPQIRIVNLETAVTSGDGFAPDKAIHYRMSPANAGCLAACRPDAVVLANNHVLDFGPAGLTDTLNTLAAWDIATVGAGCDEIAAWTPVRIPTRLGGVLLLAAADRSCGVASSWAATAQRPGVAFLPVFGQHTAAQIANRLREVRQPGDLALVSIHWGTNWGYEIRPEQAQFAHWLIDAGVDLVYGHSSHHPRPVEIYRDKLILYGCGDLINDYEGISGHSAYRPDLRVAYLVTLDASNGTLVDARLVPMRACKMSLQRAAIDDCRWLQTTLADLSIGCRLSLDGDGAILLTAD
jgi:poly-gamma-glutamate synthesis protein (capsule biosynthesis protein)